MIIPDLRYPPDHATARRRRCATAALAAMLGYTAGTLITRRWCRRELAIAWDNANRDPLTGLPNRRAALAAVNTRIAQDRPFLLAIIDLDDFKTVNDTYGHPTGDDLLATVAARLHAAVPPDGFTARMGGDEFLLLLPDHGGDPTDALTAVLHLITQPVRTDAATLHPRARAGVATSASGASTWRLLITHADQALYRAKAGTDRVAVHQPHLDTPDCTRRQSRRPQLRRRDRPPPTPLLPNPAPPDVAQPGGVYQPAWPDTDGSQPGDRA